ncbi:inositol oxygenase [Phycomyces nitens]|nr:inositol oxygenase [Phycomyces nitens]
MVRVEHSLSEALKVTEAWENFLQTKYGQNTSSKNTEAFRVYTEEETTVTKFYRENHEKQTLAHVLAQKQKYGTLDKARMGIWEALEVLNGLVDESDPDTALPQMVHALQSAEAARKDGRPRWMILVALIHDLGKYLFFMGEPQWTVVGDTFPVGCQYSDKIVYRPFLNHNPDHCHPVYSTKYGIYSPNCGLDKVNLSYGHDEYLYQVCKSYLPKEALYCIRYHSFYSCHTEGEYSWLLNDFDLEMMPFLKIFNQYDLYSKAEQPPDTNALEPFYRELINEYFPPTIDW